MDFRRFEGDGRSVNCWITFGVVAAARAGGTDMQLFLDAIGRT